MTNDRGSAIWMRAGSREIGRKADKALRGFSSVENHEILVAGAGPAGLKAAELLGKAGKDVLVVERDPEEKIGDKPCAGGLFPHSKKYFPEDLFENVLNSITIYLGDRKMTFGSDRPVIAMASRSELGKYQLKLAKEAGAQILAGTPVKGLDKEKSEVILNDDERIGYKYLIAADGSTSIIRRSLGYNTNQIVQCIEYPVPGDFEELGIYFDLKKYGLTYVWVFPHKGYASVGTGMFPSMVPAQEMNERFNRWAEDNHIDLSKAKKRAHPIYCGYHGFRHGNVFLTGDAASFACTADGEGIYQAIRSGEIAAKAIIDPKWNYRPELQDLLKYHRYGGWVIPLLVAFPGLSRRIVEGLGGMFMPTISALVPIAGSLKFIQRAGFGILGK